MDATERKLWDAYQASPGTPERDALATHYLGYARRVIARVMDVRRSRVEDYLGAAFVRIVAMLDTCDDPKNFRTYMGRSIEGVVRQADARAYPGGPYELRRRVLYHRAATKARAAAGGGLTDADLDQELKRLSLGPQQRRRMLRSPPAATSTTDAQPAAACRPLSTVDDRDEAEHALSCLEPETRALLRYLYDGHDGREAAARFGISESRLRYVVKQSLARCRAFVEGKPMPPAALPAEALRPADCHTGVSSPKLTTRGRARRASRAHAAYVRAGTLRGAASLLGVSVTAVRTHLDWWCEDRGRPRLDVPRGYPAALRSRHRRAAATARRG